MGLFDFLKPKKTRSLLDELEENPLFQQFQEINNAFAKMCEGGCETDELPNGYGEFGHDVTNPVPTHTVAGSTCYLARLRSSDGSKVLYERRGSASCETVPKPIDIYDISHPSGTHLATIYLSPYQLRNSHRAPRGLTLIEPPPNG
jgi:hypothetical protein